MMHSCRRGIIIEKYQTNKHYTSRFLFAGKLPQVYPKDSLSVDYVLIAEVVEIADTLERGDTIKTIHRQEQLVSMKPIADKDRHTLPK